MSRHAEWKMLMGDVFRRCPRCDHRDDLGAILTERGLRGEGVEVGVWLGDYAARILDRSELRRLHCVDSWAKMDDYRDRRDDEYDPQDYDRCAANLSRFGDRANMIRAMSPQAAEQFADASMDFVYLDANHSREAVEKDIRAWAPKVRPGGILAGHDIMQSYHPGLTDAVVAWLRETNTTAYIIPGDATSWYVTIGGAQ